MPTHRKKSWTEKLHDAKGLPKTVPIHQSMIGRNGIKADDNSFSPAPLQIDALMKKIHKGKLTTINHLRDALAQAHHATLTCPICTGIFANIAAHAAEEARAAGKIKITPYWRTLKTAGELNPKFPGGIPALKKLLTVEGHKITKKGARHFIADFSARLAAFH